MASFCVNSSGPFYVFILIITNSRTQNIFIYMYFNNFFLFILETRLELACHVASLIGVVKTKAEFFLNEYKPTVVLDEKHCIAGRVTLPRTGSYLTDNFM
jgi:hypothetical protein